MTEMPLHFDLSLWSREPEPCWADFLCRAPGTRFSWLLNGLSQCRLTSFLRNRVRRTSVQVIVASLRIAVHVTLV
jgi:hypothetical protein